MKCILALLALFAFSALALQVDFCGNSECDCRNSRQSFPDFTCLHTEDDGFGFSGAMFGQCNGTHAQVLFYNTYDIDTKNCTDPRGSYSWKSIGACLEGSSPDYYYSIAGCSSAVSLAVGFGSVVAIVISLIVSGRF